ncbi:hypothetical protein ACWIGI_28510 [Nocardia sp. NPDC055321]
MPIPDATAPTAQPEHPHRDNAFRGLAYAIAAELSIIGFGALLGTVAWLLDWSLL